MFKVMQLHIFLRKFKAFVICLMTFLAAAKKNCGKKKYFGRAAKHLQALKNQSSCLHSCLLRLHGDRLYNQSIFLEGGLLRSPLIISV